MVLNIATRGFQYTMIMLDPAVNRAAVKYNFWMLGIHLLGEAHLQRLNLDNMRLKTCFSFLASLPIAQEGSFLG